MHKLIPRALFCALFATTALAQERTLSWKSLEVTAKLDASGQLDVVEKQQMLFSGNWNGGERRFNLRSGQGIKLLSLEEIDEATGARTLFQEQSLEYTQSYAWHSNNTLRWRARPTSDPPFDNTLKTYVITYQLTNVLVQRDGRYRMSHDFAFADRPGIIERFSLDLTFDADWQPPADAPRKVELNHLQPGRSYVLSMPLVHRGSGAPAALNLSAPVEANAPAAAEAAGPAVRKAAGILLLLAICALLAEFLIGEQSSGRFAPAPPLAAVDRAWLDEHLFSYPPEIVGAAWDEKVGGAEVAALLARLTVEGKIASRVEKKKGLFFERDVLHLESKSDFSTHPSHERALLNALFRGSETTDTDRIRKRYKNVGFNPVSYIEPRIESSLPWERVTAKVPKFEGKKLAVAVAIYVAAIALIGWLSSADDALMLFGAGFGATFLSPILALTAFSSHKNVAYPWAGFLKFLLPYFLLAYFVSGYFVGDANVRLPALLALAFMLCVVLRHTLRLASSAGQEKRISIRKHLLTARRYLANELKKPEPQLQDGWFPYLLAFDLGRNVDRWFRSFGGSAVAGGFASSRSISSTSSLGSAASGSGGYSISGWSGGGTSFGGAGATASWGAAATSMASVVSGSSSSSGSSGSSGSGGSSSSSSGGSSGGGGGGGW